MEMTVGRLLEILSEMEDRNIVLIGDENKNRTITYVTEINKECFDVNGEYEDEECEYVVYLN